MPQTLNLALKDSNSSPNKTLPTSSLLAAPSAPWALASIV